MFCSLIKGNRTVYIRYDFLYWLLPLLSSQKNIVYVSVVSLFCNTRNYLCSDEGEHKYKRGIYNDRLRSIEEII
jgi:hypothetical protein